MGWFTDNDDKDKEQNFLPSIFNISSNFHSQSSSRFCEQDPEDQDYLICTTRTQYKENGETKVDEQKERVHKHQQNPMQNFQQNSFMRSVSSQRSCKDDPEDENMLVCVNKKIINEGGQKRVEEQTERVPKQGGHQNMSVIDQSFHIPFSGLFGGGNNQQNDHHNNNEISQLVNEIQQVQQELQNEMPFIARMFPGFMGHKPSKEDLYEQQQQQQQKKQQFVNDLQNSYDGFSQAMFNSFNNQNGQQHQQQQQQQNNYQFPDYQQQSKENNDIQNL